MGNRAIVVFEDQWDKSKVMPFGVYLHWNGGPESVLAFLKVLNERMNGRGIDMSYAAARFIEIVGRYFGGNTSLGLINLDSSDIRKLEMKNDVNNLDPGDGGIYIIGWKKAYIIKNRYRSKWFSQTEINKMYESAQSHDYWNLNEFNEPSILWDIRNANKFPMKEKESA